mmetsp:Transcript_5313/g.4907  ORF Transcript_5313/g.4907 Transcript_5313/m.4907 type:complete len:257 (+) Transcript_5313:90-860(+)
MDFHIVHLPEHNVVVVVGVVEGVLVAEVVGDLLPIEDALGPVHAGPLLLGDPQEHLQRLRRHVSVHLLLLILTHLFVVVGEALLAVVGHGVGENGGQVGSVPLQVGVRAGVLAAVGIPHNLSGCDAFRGGGLHFIAPDGGDLSDFLADSKLGGVSGARPLLLFFLILPIRILVFRIGRLRSRFLVAFLGDLLVDVVDGRVDVHQARPRVRHALYVHHLLPRLALRQDVYVYQRKAVVDFVLLCPPHFGASMLSPVV